MTTHDEWLERRTAGSPPVLLARVRQALDAAPEGTLGERLALAGESALRAAEEKGSSREAALDLLAADALVTLTLLEAAERDPAGLATAADRLLADAVRPA
ncbi:MAG TPA: hypothetical protein PLL69_07395 [Gemmatimonadales bacterium]|nr:hypothetical protein [Gemmatimonadales bacterium]